MKLLEVFRARAVLLLGAGLALSSAAAQGESGSGNPWMDYRLWAKNVYPERDVALAVAPNGSWAAESGFTKSQAKQDALHQCKHSPNNPSNATCRIVDVNLKRVDTSVATARVWCAYPRLFHGKGYERVQPDVCAQRSGTVTESANSAAYKHRRLNQQSELIAIPTNTPKFLEECQELFVQRGNRAIWRNKSFSFYFDVSHCDKYVSEDGSTWLGAEQGVATAPELSETIESTSPGKGDMESIEQKGIKRQQEAGNTDPLAQLWWSKQFTASEQSYLFFAAWPKDDSQYDAVIWKLNRVFDPDELDGVWEGYQTWRGNLAHRNPATIEISGNAIKIIEGEVFSGGRRNTFGLWLDRQENIAGQGYSSRGRRDEKGRLYFSGAHGFANFSCVSGPCLGKLKIDQDSVTPLQFVKRGKGFFWSSANNNGSLRIEKSVRGELTILAKDFGGIGVDVTSNFFTLETPLHDADFNQIIKDKFHQGVSGDSYPKRFERQIAALLNQQSPTGKGALNADSTPEEPPLTADEVIALQKALTFFGLYKGGIDGEAGPNTQKAVNQWLRKQGRSPETLHLSLAEEITTAAKTEKALIAKAEEEKQRQAEAERQSAAAKEAEAKRKAEEEERRQLAAAKEAEAKRKAEEAKQKAEEERRKAEAVRLAAEKEQKEQEEKERQLAAAKAAEKKRKAEEEKRNQQLIALRSELLKDVVSVRDLLDDYPDYPLKASLETAVNDAIAVLGLNDPEAIRTQKTILNAAAANLEDYRERQIALADAKKKEEAERQLAAAIEAEAKRKAEEEKQKAEEARLAEEQSKNASDNLAGLSLEPMDKVFQVPVTTNIRAAPQVLSDRVGRINAGESLTILAKVSGEHWYLVETDHGERGFVFADAITLASGEEKATAKVKNPAIPDIDFGKYHALVIGNNTYRELPDLQSAVNDARAVGALLETQYGFEVELLTNATRSEIFGSLASMRRRVGSNDNVLIYYAGHGWLDKEADEGYWMPVDAEEDNPGNWLSSANLISEIRRSKAKHFLVVADSCFSGTLTRGLTIKTRTPDYLERIVDKKARTALTSGGLEPVMDTGGESNHSVFATAFLSILNQNDAVLDGHQLFTLVRKKVIMGSQQTPEYGDIRRAGHDGGDFLFVRQ